VLAHHISSFVAITSLPDFYHNCGHDAEQQEVAFIWSLHFQLLKLDQQHQGCPISTPRACINLFYNGLNYYLIRAPKLKAHSNASYHPNIHISLHTDSILGNESYQKSKLSLRSTQNQQNQ
jgi:hypothetical protein